MEIIYIKTTIPALPEALRTAINSVVMLKTPEATLAKVRKEAAKRNVAATYELATREEYLAYRKRDVPQATGE